MGNVLSRSTWTRERNKFIRAVVRDMPEITTRASPSVIDLVKRMKQESDMSDKKKKSRWEEIGEQLLIWRRQLKALGKILSGRRKDTALKLQNFPEIAECRMENVTTMVLRIVEEHLKELGYEENFLGRLRDPGLEEGVLAD